MSFVIMKEFWVETINLASYLMNRSLSIPINCKALEEVSSGPHSIFVNLRIFVDVTSNESTMLSPRKEKLYTEMTPVRENVKFVPKTSKTIDKMISKSKEEEVQHLNDKENAPQEQQYCLAKDRTRRHIKPPQRYAYADLVAYALSMAKSIEMEEPQTYHEAITSREST
ncbi:hypothetical protein AAG906_032849 [Vitis piasezkii]